MIKHKGTYSPPHSRERLLMGEQYVCQDMESGERIESKRT
jgi:hypothetical protein